MNKIKLFLSFFILIVGNYNVHAEKIRIKNLNYCEASESAINDYEPKIFHKTNNLLRKAGEDPLFCGEAIVVYGRVIDQDCNPVSDAKIYAWQTNCEGKYPYKVLKSNVVDKKLIDENYKLTFVGNGTATTNNRGEFYFITLYPPSVHNYKPHLNVRVEHSSMATLQTRLTLGGHRVTTPNKDPDLSLISNEAAKEGMKVYKFEVVISNKDYDRNY
jgi:protocatechuate 3,4-dioxygenase, beta subunit